MAISMPRKATTKNGIASAVLLFMALVLIAPGKASAQASISLTDAEKAWLAENPTIRVGPAPGFPPIEFFDDSGEYRGMAADYADLLAERLGVEIKATQYENWAQVVGAAKSRDIDCWMEAGITPERREFMSFTEPYLNIPAVIIVRRDVEGSLSMSDLRARGMSVVVMKGYASAAFIHERYPNLRTLPTENIEKGLEKVSFGSADAIVTNIAAASYYIEKSAMTNLRVAGESGFVWDLAIGCRSDRPELRAVLQKGLDSLSDDERRTIYRRWVAIKSEKPARSTAELVVFFSLVLIVLLLGIFLVRNLRRRDSLPSKTRSTLRVEGLLGAWPVFALALTAVTAILAGAMWSLSVVEKRAQDDVGDALSTVVSASSKAVYDWIHERENEVQLWATRSDLGISIAEFTSDPSSSSLDTVLAPLLSSRDYTQYYLTDEKGALLASSGGAELQPSPAVLQAALQRLENRTSHAVMTLPERTAGGEYRPMLVAAAVPKSEGATPLFLIVELDPETGFSEILQRGRIGASGETYAFNRNAQLISSSRFEEQLRAAHLLKQEQHSFLNIDLRNPGGDMLAGYQPKVAPSELPLTLMAQNATAGKSGRELAGYRDYRGVPVIGVWLWDENLGLGIATEMDVSDGYAFLHSYQNQIWLGAGSAALLLLALTFVFVKNRLKMAAANEDLHDAYAIIKTHKERMEEELNVGREIQMSMVPLTYPAFPTHDEFSIFALLDPAREVGGDFYDFFFIDDDHLCFVVGDVSGKGVPAALFMAVTKTIIKSIAGITSSPAQIIEKVNGELSENNESCMFVTLFLGVIDIRSGECKCTNAGHNPPMIYRQDESIEVLDQRHGPVAGAMEGLSYGEHSFRLAAGEQLLMYTDGVTEALNSKDELYSDERLLKVAQDCVRCTVEESVDHVMKSIDEFVGEAPQADDITIMSIAFHGADLRPVNELFEIDILNRIAEIDRTRNGFDAFSEENGFSKKLSARIQLVLDELLTNVISYAFDDEKEHTIKLSVQLTAPNLVVTIIDDGIAFDPFSRSTPDTSAPIEEREIGGLGIHLAREVMDEVSYVRKNSRNVVRLIKALDDDKAS